MSGIIWADKDNLFVTPEEQQEALKLEIRNLKILYIKMDEEVSDEDVVRPEFYDSEICKKLLDLRNKIYEKEQNLEKLVSGTESTLIISE